MENLFEALGAAIKPEPTKLDPFMNYAEIEAKLKQMKGNKQTIHLRLRPPVNSTIIEKDGNRMYINDGKDGEFEDVPEWFYDRMVKLYDTRNID